MKHRIKCIMSVAGSMILLGSSCNGGNAREVKEEGESMPVIEFEGYRYDAIAEMSDSDAVDTDGGRYWRLTGTGMLPLKIGTNDISQLRDSLEKLGGVHMIDKDHLLPMSDKELTITDLTPDSVSACSSGFNQLSIVLCTPEVVVWKDYTYNYLCMAAHGVYNTSFVNYSIPEGKILSVSDIMKPGYETPLAEMIREKLKEKKVSLLVPLEEIGVPRDFEITTRGLRFVFGLYEIAAYVEGEIAVELDGYELEDILAPGAGERYFNVM